ncbi:MAG TPA: HD domain-containing phosphohydrolase [Vicinamibacterales bacterium]
MDRVLVVDDETGIRGLVTQWVESLGCTPAEAASAEQAVEAMSQTPCDVAICDVNLPGHDGLWLARHIRQFHPDTAVVLATGIQDIESAVGGLRAGIVDYLLKPFGRERFREAMDRARQWHRAAADTLRWRQSVELELQTRRRQLSDAVLRLDLSSDAAIRGALGLLTIRDRPMFEHALRVAAMAVEIANEARLSPTETADLERAAIVHEVARTVIPETILWKPGELSVEEWTILRREPDLGYELFSGIPALASAALVVRSMRERYDGTGYPQGLAGLDIPVGARILALADSYDTMIRPRGHREPLTPSDAATEIAEGRGTQFDPRVAAVLLQILGHAGFDAS